MKTIREWYQKYGRKELPWRNTRDAYAIYVSEIMLQQTQVATVLSKYYHPFLQAFPTLTALAAAPEQAVLKAWEGLGYYQRARNLHRTAKLCTPHLPETLAGLLVLPGIGRNTAHAILSFAHHQPYAVLEANVKRVVARYYAISVADFADAEKLLDRKDPFTHNQAMMDIGALICTPRAPKCTECPLKKNCKGRHAPEQYPQKAKAKKPRTEGRYIEVITDGRGRYALAPQQEARLLQGLFGFPQHTHHPGGKTIGYVVHQYSHFTLKAQIQLRTLKRPNQPLYSVAEIGTLPLSTLDRKVMKILIDHAPANRQNQAHKGE